MHEPHNKNDKSFWYTDADVLELLRDISEACDSNKLYFKVFRYLKVLPSGVPDFKSDTEALLKYNHMRRLCTIKQTLKRIFREEFPSYYNEQIMEVLYKTKIDDLLLYINDQNLLVRVIVKWRLERDK